MFFGGLILFAAVIAWGTALMMSPHGSATVAEGTEHVADHGRHASFATAPLAPWSLSALAGLAAVSGPPAKRAAARLCDPGVLTVLIASSIYQLAWLQISVLR